MKAFVITIEENEKSVKAAKRCIASGKKIGFDIEHWKATTPRDDILAIAEEHNIRTRTFKDNKFSRFKPCLSTFLSHHSLWRYCVENNEEIAVFEHDVVFIQPMPDYIPYTHMINIGQPSYGDWKNPPKLGVNRLSTKEYFPGAHAYLLKPSGAKRLLDEATVTAQPTDIFLNLKNMPWLQEHNPFIAMVLDTFSTIQRPDGCVAKHQFNEKFEIIEP
jgi:GR25 family glycosyltransferase involved in LPS biosynthesis